MLGHRSDWRAAQLQHPYCGDRSLPEEVKCGTASGSDPVVQQTNFAGYHCTTVPDPWVHAPGFTLSPASQATGNAANIENTIELPTPCSKRSPVRTDSY